MTSSLRLLIADIGPAHGIKGAVKLRLFLEDPDLLADLNPLYIGETGDKTTTLTLMQDAGKSGWVGRIDGVTNRTMAEKWRGVKLYADRAALPDLEDLPSDGDDDLGAFYVTDLIGLAVHDADTKDQVGTVVSVDNFGASDLLDVRRVVGHGSFYIPFIDDYIVDVDLDTRQVLVRDYAVFSDPSGPVEGDQS